jgi:3-dehydroquinate synthase
MAARRIEIKYKAAPGAYLVRIAGSSLEQCGDRAVECIGKTGLKAAIVSNPKVAALYGKTISRSLRKAGFDVSLWLMKDGERYKNSRSLQQALRHFSEQGLSRDDIVVALGGGVVGDLSGFGAAVYLRGIRFMQVPTTLLAMIDSSVGGKTGINSDFGKNLVGAFHRPSCVLIDPGVLKTLPRRELTAGFCETVKHAALAGGRLFDQTAAFLADFPPTSVFAVNDRSVNLIADQVAFKAAVVRNDETESTSRTDKRSRKILNFGHTFGHALEKVTDYRRFRHGEAVGYGIQIAAELSKNLDLLSQNELKSLNDVLHRAGHLPDIGGVRLESILGAIKFDKKASGSGLSWILLKGIGKPVIISEKDIPKAAISRAIRSILKDR